MLTESFAMLPGASVSGYYFWHPEARYFGLGASAATSSRTTPDARAWPSRKPSAGSRRTSPRIETGPVGTIVTGTTDRHRSYGWDMTTLPRAMRRRFGAGLLAGALALAIIPVPTVAAAGAKPYTLDLGTRSDFVAQTNFVQCVGASVQMMLNMIEPGRDRTARTQLRLQRLARCLERPDAVGVRAAGRRRLRLGGGPRPRGWWAVSPRRDADASRARCASRRGRCERPGVRSAC